ncbi:hypothetical protein A2U01_0090244, partial [Trifolium medium]|nr:hypothetical protein [Trifolium medium]
VVCAAHNMCCFPECLLVAALRAGVVCAARRPLYVG